MGWGSRFPQLHGGTAKRLGYSSAVGVRCLALLLLVACNSVFGIEERQPGAGGTGASDGGSGAMGGVGAGGGGGLGGGGGPPDQLVVALRTADGAASRVRGVDAAESGGIYIGGSMEGSIELDPVALMMKGGADGFVAELDAFGRGVWGQVLGQDGVPATQHVWDVVSVDDGVFASLVLSGSVDFAGGLITAKAGNDAAVLKYDSDGAQLDHALLSGDMAVHARNMARLGQGVVLSGHFLGSMSFGGNMISAQTMSDGYVAEIGADLSAISLAAIESGGDDLVHEAAAAPGTAIGCGWVIGANNEILVAQRGPQSWLRVISGASNDLANSVEAANGRVFVGGFFFSTVVVDDGQTTLTSASSDNNGLLLALDGATGGEIWHHQFATTAGSSIQQISIDADDNLIIAMHVLGPVDLGGGMLSTTANPGIALVRMSQEGDYLASTVIEGNGEHFVDDIAPSSDGAVLISGEILGDITVGGMKAMSNNVVDGTGFVAKVRF